MADDKGDPPPLMLEDEGELEVQIGTVPGPAGPVIVVRFGKPVAWLGLGAEHARALAALLIARADQIEEGTMPTVAEVIAENERLRAENDRLRTFASDESVMERVRAAMENDQRRDTVARLTEDLAIARRATEIARQENLKLHRRLSDQSIAHDRDRSQRLTAGMEMVWTDAARMFGQPCIHGTRIPVAQILDMLAGGDSIKEIAAALPESLDELKLRDLLLELANRL